MTQEQLEKLNTIVTTYGDNPQVDMCLEELAELNKACSDLQKVLLKYRRKTNGYTKDEDVKEAKRAVIEELADVSIMVEQMKIIYGYEAVEQWIEFKINRQMDRLQNRGNEDAEK